MTTPSPRRIVLALGGNAISSGDHTADISGQFAQSRVTARHVADLIQSGHHVLLTHGNGPQVGTVLRRVELSRHEVYPIDLGLCVADTQAGMGYMIGQCIQNEMSRRNAAVRVCTIVTTVFVHPDDPAFEHPGKPIGPVYSEATAKKRIRDDGWVMVKVPDGFRRVVPSPKPLEIHELELIHHLFDENRVVVCCGGGGIPVVRRADGTVQGVEAVIDKDLTAALLAAGSGADTLAILTDVQKVCLDYGKPGEKQLDRLTISQARRLMSEGQFPPGSMGPKIQACINFLEAADDPGAMAVITSIAGCTEALAGTTGTRIVRDNA